MSNPNLIPCLQEVDRDTGELCLLAARVICEYSLGGARMTRTLCDDEHTIDLDEDRAKNAATYAKSARPISASLANHTDIFPIPDTLPDSLLKRVLVPDTVPEAWLKQD